MRFRRGGVLVALVLGFVLTLVGCRGTKSQEPVSSSGVKQYTVTVPVDNQGRSIEQRLIAERLLRDNQPGAFKYVYVINAYTGTVMYQSIAVGKVVSSGKRLTPSEVAATDGQYVSRSLNGISVEIGGKTYATPEVLQDDGSYGSSSEYLYWIDPQNGYHQVYAGAVYVHVSSVPLVVRNATLTMEVDEGRSIDVAPEVRQLLKEFGFETP